MSSRLEHAKNVAHGIWGRESAMQMFGFCIQAAAINQARFTDPELSAAPEHIAQDAVAIFVEAVTQYAGAAGAKVPPDGKAQDPSLLENA